SSTASSCSPTRLSKCWRSRSPERSRKRRPRPRHPSRRRPRPRRLPQSPRAPIRSRRTPTDGLSPPSRALSTGCVLATAPPIVASMNSTDAGMGTGAASMDSTDANSTGTTAASMGTTAAPESTDASDAQTTLRRYGILIVGGGNGGLSVAGRLRRAGVDDIAVIEPNDTHYFKQLFSHVAGGTARASETMRPQRDVIPKGVEWIKDSVTAVDPAAHEVHLASGRTLGYERLIL